MPRIFDNIENKLITSIKDTLQVSERSDFCVGYFNLRGWKLICDYIDKWSGEGNNRCRLLIGMQKTPHETFRKYYSISTPDEIDNNMAIKFKKQITQEFKDQLVFGIPSEEDEITLRRLSSQLKSNKVVLKLFLRHDLHAKLYLFYRDDKNNPITGYLGSSNLTFSGLEKQGELNIDVLDHDATQKLEKWFEDRWEDQWCIDISKELAEIIDNSWSGDHLRLPYHIYLKIVYHLSQEAREGLLEYKIPRIFENKLLDFQIKAVQIATHHLNKRNGVLIGDVVGLGKTLMATAIAKIFENDFDIDCLIICPKNLEQMWEKYKDDYSLRAKVVPISKFSSLKELKRYRLVLIDESHNLRNRDGKRYKIIRDYILRNESKVVLLTATPYNKTYLDLSNQLRLFITDDQELHIRPERLLQEMGETQFMKEYQVPVRSISAFEKSFHPDDWRDLMRFYMVRRTRGFIKENYAKTDEQTGRKYLEFSNGERSYFPTRTPKSLKFNLNENNPNDQYAKLYSKQIVDLISSLYVPRYGLANYLDEQPIEKPTPVEDKIIANLSKAGKRLMGFCRTNLFKRLESSGYSFQLSIERHILRNYIFIHAIDNGLPLPIGTQNAEFFDNNYVLEDDFDLENTLGLMSEETEEKQDESITENNELEITDEEIFSKKAKKIYEAYHAKKNRFKWISSKLFNNNLKKHLIDDSKKLLKILNDSGIWKPESDEKLNKLYSLLKINHRNEKVLIFTQYADTANYLYQEMKSRGIDHINCATGNTENPTELAFLFSPVSNEKQHKISPEEELRILIATDVLSEGQNLQDCSIIVNYDLPWAIIKLIQRAGRIDRIGQKSEQILSYTFLPADGVEKIIFLRGRLKNRLCQNAEVIGTDERFFEDEEHTILRNLYHEKAGIMDDEDESDVDLASYAYQIWKNATDIDPKLKSVIPQLPDVIYATKKHKITKDNPTGVIVYTKTADDNDILAWIDQNHNIVTQSQIKILNAVKCEPDTEPLQKIRNHHKLVESGVKHILEEEKLIGGQLGKKSGARFRVYERLKKYQEDLKDTPLLESKELKKVIEDIYKYPLTEIAVDAINRQLKSGVSDQDLFELANSLRQENKLSLIRDEIQTKDPQIICSLGLADEHK